MNGVIINGAVYEAHQEDEPGLCRGCDLRIDGVDCHCTDLCIDWECIFRFSQELTDKLNEK